MLNGKSPDSNYNFSDKELSIWAPTWENYHDYF